MPCVTDNRLTNKYAKGAEVEATMSLLHNRTHHEYGIVLALICMALALVVAKYSRQQASVEFPSAIASGVEEGK